MACGQMLQHVRTDLVGIYEFLGAFARLGRLRREDLLAGKGVGRLKDRLK